MRKKQLERARELREAVPIEEVGEIMYKIDFYDKNNIMIDKITKGFCQNALVQTNENQSSTAQTEQM